MSFTSDESATDLRRGPAGARAPDAAAHPRAPAAFTGTRRRPSAPPRSARARRRAATTFALLAQHGFVEQVPTDDGRERRWHSTRAHSRLRRRRRARRGVPGRVGTRTRGTARAERRRNVRGLPLARAPLLTRLARGRRVPADGGRRLARPSSSRSRERIQAVLAEYAPSAASGSPAAHASSTSAFARCRSRDPAAPPRERSTSAATSSGSRSRCSATRSR